MCRVCGCYRGGMVVMDGATSEMGRPFFRAANVWWRCVHYFDIASYG